MMGAFEECALLRILVARSRSVFLYESDNL